MTLLSRLLSGVAYGPLYAPDTGSGTGGAVPAAPAAEPAPVVAAAPVNPAPAVPAEPAAAPPAADPAPAAAPADAARAEPGAAAPAADKAPAAKPEFAPSLLDEAAKPAADAKPSDKPADAKSTETKPGDAKKDDAATPPADKAPPASPEPAAPIEYAFAYPEGFDASRVDTERMGAFTALLNEARVAPQAAQKMLDMHLGELDRVADAITTRQWDVFNNTQNEWRKETMADPEIGGARHDTALKTVMSLVDAFGNRFTGKQARDADTIAAERKELLDVFRMTGAANNRLILGLLHFAGESRREGAPRPAPTPRVNANAGGNRGLNRYRGSTPAR